MTRGRRESSGKGGERAAARVWRCEEDRRFAYEGGSAACITSRACSCARRLRGAGSCGSGHGSRDGATRPRGTAKAAARSFPAHLHASKKRAPQAGANRLRLLLRRRQRAGRGRGARRAKQSRALAGWTSRGPLSQHSPYSWLASRVHASLLETIRPVATCMQIEMATSPRSRASGWEHLSARLDPA